MSQQAADPTGGAAPSDHPVRRRAVRQWWPVLCVLALVVASEYKFRLRANDQAVAGNADPFVLLEIGIYLLVAAFLFLRFRPSTRIRRAEPITYLLYAYVLVLVGSALYSPYLDLAAVRAGQVVVILALARSIARHADADAPHRIAHGFAALAALSVVFGVLVPFPRLRTQPDRFTWLYIHPVQAGEILAIAVVLLTGYTLTYGLRRGGPHWPIPVYVLLLLICLAGLVATKTRGAVVGAVAGILVLLWTRWRGSRKVELCVVAAAVLTVVALTSSDAIESFFARGESAEALSTLSFRTTLWGYALELAGQHPLYGFGLTATRGVFLESTGLGGGHNAVINLLVDTGLVGVLTWLALIGTVGYTAVKLSRVRPEVLVTRILVLGLLAGMFTNSMFTQGLGAPATVSCTWLFVLAAWTVTTRRRQDEQTVAGLEEREPR
ncbi:O-antigen ligase family protein [Amycolatopsis nigrescens]|uniref:O-antigen ligase family protein n=1 Tax=Amycolatopsis nigrescens TaxID=381445 RepID=UPI000370A122|nr:O-antigen ligase family protein [Amycolatopsis nigrescens]